MAATFDFRDEDGASLGDVARIDTMVTVVDAANLLADFGSTDFLHERGETAGDGDGRTLVDLLVDQIEFADVVVTMAHPVDARPQRHRDRLRRTSRSADNTDGRRECLSG